jgi:hypothetical protein
MSNVFASDINAFLLQLSPGSIALGSVGNDGRLAVVLLLFLIISLAIGGVRNFNSPS